MLAPITQMRATISSMGFKDFSVLGAFVVLGFGDVWGLR